MKMDLSKQVALITGGASGIGLEIGTELLKNGIKGIAIVDINPIGDGISKQLNDKYGVKRVIFARSDVSDKNDLKLAFERTIDAFGNLDMVFNNAGLLDEIEPERCYKVNVIGAANCTQLAMDEFLPKYKTTNEGIIINTASVVALKPTYWNSIPYYTSSKSAVLGLSQALSQDFHYKRTSIKIITICPGITLTPMFSTNKPVHTDEIEKAMEGYETQTAEDLAKHIIPILKQGKNGSIWRLEGKQRKEVHIPML